MSDLYYTTDSLDLLPLRRAIPSPESRSTRAEIGPTHDDWSEQRRWRWGYLGDSTGRQLPFPRTSNPSTESQGSHTPPSILLARELEMGRVSVSDLDLHDHRPRSTTPASNSTSSAASRRPSRLQLFPTPRTRRRSEGTHHSGAAMDGSLRRLGGSCR